MYTYPGVDEYLDGVGAILTLLKDNGELEGTTPRGLVVRREEEPWIAVRSDGRVLARHGSTHIREMWLKGADEIAIAQQIQSLAHWGEVNAYPVGRRDEVELRKPRGQ
jgi:hypothetical protein